MIIFVFLTGECKKIVTRYDSSLCFSVTKRLQRNEFDTEPMRVIRVKFANCVPALVITAGKFPATHLEPYLGFFQNLSQHY